MDVGKILSGSQLLQRSQGIEAVTHTEGTNADGNQSYSYHEEHQQEKTLSSEQVNGMTDALNKFLEPTKASLKFEFHEKLEEYYVTLVDSNTKEVIREIPPKKMLDIYAAMAEFMGLIVDKKI